MTWLKLSEGIVQEVIKRYRAGESLSALAQEFGVTKSNISYHVRRRTGERKDVRKLSPKQIDRIVQRWQEGETATSLARDFGVALTTIRSHIRQRTSRGPGRFRRAQRVFPPTDPAALAYLAAMIDAEGCIHRGRSKGREYWHVTITNTSSVLEAWLRQFGGAFYYPAPSPSFGGSPRNRKRVFVWMVVAALDVSRLLRSVLPYLLEKREKAQQAVTEIDSWVGIPSAAGRPRRPRPTR